MMDQRGRDEDRDLDQEGPDQDAHSGDLDPEQSPAAGDDAPSVDELVAAAEEAEAAVESTGAVREALAQLKREVVDAQDRYLRTYADFENYRKRMQRDLAEHRKYANEQMALDLLTVVDHLGLAIQHAREAGGSGQGLQEGVELVYRQFCDVLEKYGIKPFKAEGEVFDPQLHDAMMQVERGDVPDNTVVQVFQAGYQYHEKVLRHARVGVSKRTAGAAAGSEPPAAGGDDVQGEE